jgi:hypothetical protein
MDKNSDKKEKFFYKLTFIGIFIVLSWWGLDEYLRMNAPRVLNQEQGKIYEKNYHGTTIYLNLTEHILVYALPGTFFLILIYLMIFESLPNKK